MIPLLLVFSSGQVFFVTSQNNGNPYYGVPLGALHYSDGNTRAEAYAANEYTVIFHHFTHRPRQLGCTSMIIGPPRTTDRNTVNGGVFLSISQPMIASQPTIRRRFTRQVSFSIFGMHNWPVEFGHLELRKDGKEPITTQQKDPFAGIEIDMNPSEDLTPKTKDIHIEGISGPEITASSTTSTTNFSAIFSSVATTQNDFSSESMNEITLFDTNTTNIFDGSEVSEKIGDEVEQSNPTTDNIIITNKNTTTVTNTEKFNPEDLKSTSESEDFHTGAEFEGDERLTTTISSNDILKRPLTTAEGNQNDIRNEEGQVDNEIKDVVKNGDSSEIFANGDVFLHERNGYPLKQEKLLSHHEKKAEKSIKFDRKDKGFPIMLGETISEKWARKSLRQSTAEKRTKGNEDKSATDDYLLSDKFFKTDGDVVLVSTQNAAITTMPLSRESTPLYWVIQDPRLTKRRRMELQKKNKHENNLDHRAVTTVTTTAIESRLKVHIDRRFELPLIEDKTVVFSVTNDAKITEYQWIALRDHCAQKTIPLLSLKGIDPPHEEKIGALLGQSHNVTSQRVQILNCNTIFIPDFVFDQGNDTSETYFYIGIGHFPDRIEKQVRAYVVGQPPDQPLRNYKSENVMIRLPKTYRTFDIDFISVFNEIERRSYGHVITPSLLVPPCNDYDVI
ncbi:hypothetical protein ACH3XW_43015 [Acanthocheilonema viteae]